MRAIEVYIAVVYMLTISFHHLRHLSFFPVYRPATRSNSFKRHSIEKSGEMLMANIIPEQKKVDLAEVIQENYRTAQEVPQTIERNSARSAKVESANQHQSMAARLSTWLGVTQPQQVPVQSWDVDTERGASPVENAIITPWYAPEPQEDRTPSAELVAPPALDDHERRGPSPTSDSPVEKTQELPPWSAPPSAALPVEIADKEPEMIAVPDRDWQDLEYSNAVRDSGIGVDVLARALSQKHYKAQDDSPMTANIQVVAPPSDDEASLRPDSIDATSQYYPASPLASTTATPLARSRPLPPMPVPSRPTSMLPSPISPMVPDSARSSNISVLVRRQNELDESIAALRLFSPSKQQFDVNQAPGNSATNDYYQYSQDPSGAAAFGPSTETESAAYGESWTSPDFPLTTPRTKPQSSARSEFFFDQQPPLNRMSADSAVIPVENQVKASNQLAPPRMPVSRFSDGSSVGDREARIDSMGTQYDITSFVGNLTVPMNHASMMSSTSAAYSEEGSVNVATIADPPTFARPTLVTQRGTLPLPQVPPMPAMATSLAARRALPPIPQPTSLLQVPQVQAPMPVATGDAPPRFRRAVGLPAHPRPQLSVRNLTPVQEKSSPSDTATLVTSPLSGSGTPLTGKA